LASVPGTGTCLKRRAKKEKKLRKNKLVIVMVLEQGEQGFFTKENAPSVGEVESPGYGRGERRKPEMGVLGAGDLKKKHPSKWGGGGRTFGKDVTTPG